MDLFRHSLVCLTVSSFLLTGCSGSDNDNGNVGEEPAPVDRTYVVFSPATGDMPIPNDLMFKQGDAADGTLTAGDDTDNPVIAGIDYMDGNSVVAPIDVTFSSALASDQIIDATSFVSIQGNVVPNPNQNIFLLPLSFPGGDALQQTTVNGQSVEIPVFADIAAYQAAVTSADIATLSYLAMPSVRADLLSLDGGTNNVIRLNPLRPLQPETKYLLVITGLKDAKGNSVHPSIAYDFIKNPESTLTSSALESVRGAIQGWEQLAAGYFSFIEQVYTAAGMPVETPTVDDIILSMTFTTTAPDSVLKSMATPEYFFEKSLRTGYRQEAIRKLATGVYTPAGPPPALQTATDIAINTTLTALLTSPTLPNAPVNPLYNPAIAAAISAGANYSALAADPMAAHIAQRAAAEAAIQVHNSGDQAMGDQAPYITIAQEAVGAVMTMSQAIQAPASSLFPIPSPRSSSFYTYADASAINPALTAPAKVYQGQITLPVYQQLPEGGFGTNIVNSTWQADVGLGAMLSASSDSTVPPSSKVTYRYPFPQKQADTTVPLLATLPDAATLANFGITKPENGWPVVIFVHGITSDRSTSLPMADALAFACVRSDLSGPSGAPCFATVAIDHPLHGVAAEGSRVPGLSSVSNPAQLPQALPGMSAPSATLTERHYNYTSGNNFFGPVPMSYVTNTGDSGSLFINLQNFANSRDSMRQMVIDLLNLNASLETMDVDGDGTANDLDSSRVFVVGHSLGAINALTFAAINNSDEVQSSPFSGNPLIRGISAIAPGGGIPRLLVNSPAFAPEILPGLAAASAELQPGKSGLETYLSVFQGVFDSADALNYVSSLNGTTGVLISEIIGNGVDHPFDQVIPPGADTRWGEAYAPRQQSGNNGFAINSSAAPLSGTEPLIYLTGAQKTTEVTAGTAPVVMVTRYTEGSHNTSIVGGNTDIDPLTSAAVFNEMLHQTVTLFAQDGIPLTGSPVANPDVIEP